MASAGPEVHPQAPAGKTLREQVIAATGEAVQSRVAGLVVKPWFWVAFIGAIFSVLLIGAFRREMPKPPPRLYTLPAFELVNERGERYGSAQLLGHIWVADFVFTSCPTVCPKLTKRMGELQHRGRNLGDAFHLVTFTVDPDNDTPERLAAYAKTYRASPRRWTFLTGPLGEVETTVVKGFKQVMGKDPLGEGGIFEIFHGEKFVLVDAEGTIRGYYDADDPGLDKLLHDIGILVNVRSPAPTGAPTSGLRAPEAPVR